MARLGYNYNNDRYGILEHDLWIDLGLHCGEPVEVKINGKWVKDRMEYDHKINNWYLVKSRLIGEQLEYLEVKI